MPNGCPSRGAVVASMVIAVRGSICQRSPGSWEPRVFVGVDPTTKRLCYRSTTIRGNRADAQRQLDAMVASIRAKNAVGLRSRATCWGRDSRSIVTVAPELTPPTAAFTGARRAQLLGLPWRNIDLERGRISFCAGWVEGPHGSVLTDTKTKRRHSVDLDPGCIDVLAEYAECCRARGSLQSPDGFVFSDTTETPHGNRTASRKRSSA